MILYYKGSLYEENYHHGPVAFFNLDFIDKLHKTTETIGHNIFKLVKSENVEINKEYLISKLDNIDIYVIFKPINHSMEVSSNKEEAIITINSEMTDHFKFDKIFFITLLHEVIHIYQRAHNINPDISVNWTGEKLEDYLNDPTEVNAYLTSIISYITYYPKKIEEFKNMNFNDFIAACFELIDFNEKDFFNELHFSTKNKILEVFRLFQGKLKQGFFDRFSNSIK